MIFSMAKISMGTDLASMIFSMAVIKDSTRIGKIEEEFAPIYIYITNAFTTNQLICHESSAYYKPNG